MKNNIAVSSYLRRLTTAAALTLSLPALSDSVVDGSEAEAIISSKQWADTSSQHLAGGDRQAAIAAALSAFPSSIIDEELESYAAAYHALYSALHADIGRFPITESHAHITAISPDRKRAVKRSERDEGGRLIELLDLTSDASILLISDQESHSAYRRYDPQVFSQDGQYLLVGSEDGQVLLFNPDDGSLLKSLPAVVQASAEGPYPYFSDFVISPSGNRLAVLQQNPVAITVWDLDDPDLDKPALQWKAERLNALANFPRGQTALLAANFGDESNLCLGLQSVNLQDLSDSFISLSIANIDTGDLLHIDTLGNAAASPDANISCSYDQRFFSASYSQHADDPGHFHILKIWSLPEAELIHIEQNAAVIGFDHSSQYLGAYTPAGPITIKVDDMSKVDYPYGPEGFMPKPPVIFGEGNTQHQVTTTTPGTLHHFSRYLWKQLPVGVEMIKEAEKKLDEQTLADIATNRAQHRGDSMVSGTEATSRQWASRSAQLLAMGERQEAIAAALKGIPASVQDDDALIPYSEAYRALYLAVASRSVKLPISGQEGWGYYAISPDRSRVSLTSNFPEPPLQFELWDVDSGQHIAVLLQDTHGEMTYAPVPSTFSDDGRLIAAGKGNEVLLFSAIDGTRLANLKVFPELPDQTSLPRYAQRIALTYNLRFNPAGDQLMALSKEGTDHELRFWHIGETPELISAFVDSDFRQLAPLPDGHLFVYANWATNEHACLILTSYSVDSGKEMSTVVVGLLDPITGTFRQYGKADIGGIIFDRTMDCHNDGRVIGVTHPSEESNQTEVSFWKDDGQDEAFFTHPVHSGFVVFDPDSENVALLPQFVGSEAWTFLNFSDKTEIEPPFAMSDYTPRPPTVYTSDGRSMRPNIIPANHAHWIWPRIPSGAALIDYGMSELDESLRQAMTKIRESLE